MALGFTVWVLAACVPPMPGDEQAWLSGVDGGVAALDAGEPCPQRVDGTCPDLTWTKGSAFPCAVEDHATAVVTSGAATWGLVTGGLTTRQNGAAAMRRSVMRAPIDDDGQPGAWTEAATLPRPMALHAQAQAGNHVYWAGGVTSENTVQVPHISVFMGTVQPDGHVLVTELPPLLRPAVHASASVVQGWLVVVGGAIHKAQATVQMAPMHVDGTVDAFMEGPPLPMGRSHHAAVTWDGHIYLLGGFTSDGEAATAVLRSVHAGDGTLVGWEAAGSMPVPTLTSSAFVHAGEIFAVGGGAGGPGSEVFADALWKCVPTGQGVLGTWSKVADGLPQPRAHVRDMPALGGHVWSVGGRTVNGLQGLGDVLVGRLW